MILTANSVLAHSTARRKTRQWLAHDFYRQEP